MKTLFLAVSLALAAPALASDDAPADSMDEPVDDLQAQLGPPGPPVTDEGWLDAETYRIGKGLRCPVCQTSIQDSSAQSAADMRKRVRELLAMGYQEADIHEYFVTKYNESILLAPPASGWNWIIWIVPSLAGGFGLALVTLVVAQWRQEPDDVPLPSETGDAPLDAYEQRLLDEIDR